MPTMNTLTIGGTTWDIEGGVTSVNGQTGAVVLDAEDVGAATEQDIADAIIQVLPVDSASGSIASFPDGYPAPVEALSVTIKPAQSGSGTPAPDNVRPISGWTEARIWCEATHDTSADPKVTIDLSGTRYGGTLDVKTGVLTVTKVTVTFSGTEGEGWTVYSSSAFYTDISGKADGYGTSICDRYKNLNDAAWVSNLFSVYSDHPSLNRIYVRPPYDGFTMTTTAWRAWLASNPLTFCYDLATPLSVQLTPAELSTLLGQNNVWADTGSVTLTYRADIQKYIDKKLS